MGNLMRTYHFEIAVRISHADLMAYRCVEEIRDGQIHQARPRLPVVKPSAASLPAVYMALLQKSQCKFPRKAGLLPWPFSSGSGCSCFPAWRLVKTGCLPGRGNHPCAAMM